MVNNRARSSSSSTTNTLTDTFIASRKVQR
jgi:hypothetical protein